jgi:catechol 2,3-dioxygenase-like lactoylglutathione lyase family enzyme
MAAMGANERDTDPSCPYCEPTDGSSAPAFGAKLVNSARIKAGRRGEMSMSVGVLDHYNVSTRNLGETVRFYEEVLGLVNGPRPPFDFPGAWLYSEGHPVLHLNDISPTDKPQRPDSGVIDHIAFGSRGFEAMKQHLSRKGVSFRANEVPNSTRRQIFVTDPNNVLIELNFDVAKETASR